MNPLTDVTTTMLSIQVDGLLDGGVIVAEKRGRAVLWDRQVVQQIAKVNMFLCAFSSGHVLGFSGAKSNKGLTIAVPLDEIYDGRGSADGGAPTRSRAIVVVYVTVVGSPRSVRPKSGFPVTRREGRSGRAAICETIVPSVRKIA